MCQPFDSVFVADFWINFNGIITLLIRSIIAMICADVWQSCLNSAWMLSKSCVFWWACNKCTHASILSYVQLCSSMDCSLPSFSVHGIFQARILEGCCFLLQGFSWPRDRTHISCISCIGRQVLYHHVTWSTLVSSVVTEKRTKGLRNQWYT